MWDVIGTIAAVETLHKGGTQADLGHERDMRGTGAATASVAG